jgi:hypothetical protein
MPYLGQVGNHEPFVVPLHKIKEGHPTVRLNPLKLLKQSLHHHLNQGGTELSFYKQDHSISVVRTVSLAGWCRLRKNNGPTKAGYASKQIHFKVVYKGDPELKLSGTVNDQMAGTMPSQVNQNLPFTLDSATFQPNMPHYIGQCPPKNDPVIRINYSGAGKAQIRFKIRENGQIVNASTVFYDSKIKQTAHLDLAYRLKKALSPGGAKSELWSTINKTFTHPLEMIVSFRETYSDSWSEPAIYGLTQWKHRCTPKVNFNLPKTQGGKVQPTTPKSVNTFQAQPTAPKPTDTIRTRPQVIGDPVPVSPSHRAQTKRQSTSKTPARAPGALGGNSNSYKGSAKQNGSFRAQPTAPKPADTIRTRPQVIVDPVPATPSHGIRATSRSTSKTPAASYQAPVEETSTVPARAK